ncbi:type II toxin-antitoxin system PemK/MazF family toxin [Brooklawnia sp.]|uniref:type II toxin-antitoxin system PemK/MazF family toxin n=1 Tax=Brooklawnia sp. TaxID=2699740 RepID=UPI00311E5A1B
MKMQDFGSLVRLAGRLLRDATSTNTTSTGQTGHSAQAGRPGTATANRPAGAAGQAGGLPAADFDGLPQMRYQAKMPGGFTSGEMVWTWVAFEEDSSQGKDRPVLLIGAEAGWLLGLPATSKDHDRDAAQENRAGRFWVEIGSGDWDSRRRVSEVRTDRIVRIDPAQIRRASGRVSAVVFQEVAAGVSEHWDD